MLYDISQWNVIADNVAYTYHNEEDGSLYIKAQYTGSADTYGNLDVITKTPLSIDGRQILKIRGSVFSYTTHVLQILLVDNSGNILKTYHTPQAPQTWVNISEDVDISDVGGNVRLKIHMAAYHGMQPTQIRFTELSVI